MLTNQGRHAMSFNITEIHGYGSEFKESMLAAMRDGDAATMHRLKNAQHELQRQNRVAAERVKITPDMVPLMIRPEIKSYLANEDAEVEDFERDVDEILFGNWYTSRAIIAARELRHASPPRKAQPERQASNFSFYVCLAMWCITMVASAVLSILHVL